MTKSAAKPAQPKGGRQARRSSGGGVAKPPRRPAKQAAATAAPKQAAPTAASGMEVPAAAAAAPAAAGKPNRPPTAFESRLYAVCKCIPAGRVATYGVMAEVLGSAPRACGQVGSRDLGCCREAWLVCMRRVAGASCVRPSSCCAADRSQQCA